MTHSATQELQFHFIFIHSLLLKLISGIISFQDSSPLLPHVKLQIQFVAQTGVVKTGYRNVCRGSIYDLFPAEKNMT
jgi:hypothetical protein